MEAAEEKSSTASIIIFIIAASFAGLTYFQGELTEDLFGINLQKIIHGEEASRTISSVEMPKQNRQAQQPSPQSVSDSQGKIVLSGVDINMEVFINGAKINFVGTPLEVPLDQELTVLVKQPGYMPFMQKVTLSKAENSIIVKVPEMERARLGLLTTSQNYTAGSKLIYEEAGQTIEKDLPFKDLQFPEGTYQAKIVNPILGTEKNVEFTIEENKKHFLE
jgi:hypothetical protein